MIDYAKYNSGSYILNRIADKARSKMFEQFMLYAAPTENDCVLDVGVTPDNKLISYNFFEKKYPWTGKLTMCSIEDASDLERDFPGSKFVRNEPGKPFPFADNQFDTVFLFCCY